MNSNLYLNHDLLSLVLSHNIDDLYLIEQILAEYPDQATRAVPAALRITLTSIFDQEVEALGARKILQYLTILWKHHPHHGLSSDVVKQTAAMGLTPLLAYYVKEYNFQAYLSEALLSAVQHDQVETIKYIFATEGAEKNKYQFCIAT